MNADEPESRQVPVDVLPPLPKDASHVAPPAPFAGLRTFYHPASGVVILGIDILVFGPEMLSGFLDTPVMCALAFFTTLPLVWVIQSRWSKDTMAVAFGKAFLGAFLAGLPFSIAGTMLGAAVLALSGLPHHPADLLKKLTSPQDGSARK
jgi:hypothetical protein